MLFLAGVSLLVPFAIDIWAWAARRPSVPWWRFFTVRQRLLQSDLYSREGRQRRNLAVRAYLLGTVMAASLLLISGLVAQWT